MNLAKRSLRKWNKIKSKNLYTRNGKKEHIWLSRNQEKWKIQRLLIRPSVQTKLEKQWKISRRGMARTCSRVKILEAIRQWSIKRNRNSWQKWKRIRIKIRESQMDLVEEVIHKKLSRKSRMRQGQREVRWLSNENDLAFQFSFN